MQENTALKQRLDTLTWEELLGRCLSIPRAAPARKGVRRLLRRLFERREDYDAVRDNALVSAAFVLIRAYVEDGARRPAAVSHNDAVQAALTISKLVKLASTRVRNWQVLQVAFFTGTQVRILTGNWRQAYCCEHPKSLSLLLACVQGMPVETTEATLRLCSAAFACPASDPGNGLGGLGGANTEWSAHAAGKPRAPAAHKKGKAASARAAAAADRYEALSSGCS